MLFEVSGILSLSFRMCKHWRIGLNFKPLPSRPRPAWRARMLQVVVGAELLNDGHGLWVRGVPPLLMLVLREGQVSGHAGRQQVQEGHVQEKAAEVLGHTVDCSTQDQATCGSQRQGQGHASTWPGWVMNMHAHGLAG